eukprot:scaffold295409_cov22-Tisochrysis_lutea.AAC.1
MPNLAAVLRAKQPIIVGLETYEWFDAPYNMWYEGKVDKIQGSNYSVKYADGSQLVIHTEAELRAIID